MKTLAFFVFGICAVTNLSARDLTYKFGAGYRQSYTNARVDNSGAVTALQVNGLEATYGIGRDLSVGGFFGFVENFDFAMMGPSLRYDFQRLINRDATLWNNFHLFTEAAFLVKFGGESEAGVVLHAPYLGFELLPFSGVNFAISSSAGLVIDFGTKNKFGFTQGILGDLGIKYYF